MSETNPRESDLILGGQNPPPVDAAVLGGLAGVRQRLESESIAERLWALNNAVQYGENAIDLSIQALSDEAEEVRRLAKRLLRNRLGEAGKEALLDRDPMRYFTTLNDWHQEIYTPEVGIVDPDNNAYIVRIEYSHTEENCDLSKLESLLKESRIKELQALILKIDLIHTNSQDNSLDYEIWWNILNTIDTTEDLCDLKALYIGDEIFDRYEFSFHQSRFVVLDISFLLEKFPNLEILHIYGNFKVYYLVDTHLKHNGLRTFTINTTCLKKMIDSLCPCDMPKLEFFECSLNYEQSSEENIETILPILSSSAAPALKYLNLSNYSDNLIEVLAQTPIFQNLAVLNIKIRSLNMFAAEEIFSILNNYNNIKLLNIYFNGDTKNLSTHYMNKFQQLPFRVECHKQNYGEHPIF